MAGGEYKGRIFRMSIPWFGGWRLGLIIMPSEGLWYFGSFEVLMRKRDSGGH
jgi:hypothetical protein